MTQMKSPYSPSKDENESIPKLGTQSIKAYWYIVDYIKDKTYPPCYREIANHLEIAKSGAGRYVYLLIQYGYLSMEYYQGRTLVITDKKPEW